jgi:putative pyruvate formate lyase activating enzyme
MWRLLRPDAARALQDPKVKSSLGRYVKVVHDELPARFQVCKRVEVKVDLNAKTGELWEKHEEGLAEFYKLLSEIDRGKIELENLDVPEVSLLDLKIELSNRILESCHLCEHRCGVNRLAGERGFCGVGKIPRVASEFMHMGEEAPLVPSYTIFFAGCTFRCQFCQNWDISQDPQAGAEMNAKELARLVEHAKKEEARNVNWVGGNPDPNLPTILEVLRECEANISSVWNSNMYYSSEAAKLLAGTQDIYLTDFKWFDNRCAEKYSKVKRYLEVVSRNHLLAHKDAELIIRHLVMPGHLECCTRPILKWIAENLGKNVRVNVMDQYRPCYLAGKYQEINRPLTAGEYQLAVKFAEEAGLQNLE